MTFSPKKVLANSWAETWPFWDIFGQKSKFLKFVFRRAARTRRAVGKPKGGREPKRPTTGAGAARTTNLYILFLNALY